MNKLIRYEYEKHKLLDICEDAEEYEKEIKALIKRLGL